MVPAGVTDRGQYYALGLGVAVGTLVWGIFDPYPDNIVVYWLGLIVADLIGIWVCMQSWKKYKQHRSSSAA
jgi:hypothetical protein